MVFIHFVIHNATYTCIDREGTRLCSLSSRAKRRISLVQQLEIPTRSIGAGSYSEWQTGYRMEQHFEGENAKSFTKKYKCFYLVHYERYQYINDAIDREKELKGLSRKKKDTLIAKENPNWKFLNEEIKEG